MKKKINTPAANRMISVGKILATLLIIIADVIMAFAQSPDRNYVITRDSRVSGLIDDATLATASTDKSKVQISVQYVDGLGRPMQTIQWKGSPLGNDVISPMAYDIYGREVRKYLPYVPTTGTAGYYRSDAIASAQAAFYNAPPSGVVQIPVATQVAYSETRPESSPLGRTLEQGAPGLSWKIGGDHTVSSSYTVNSAADAVKLWVVGASGGASYSTTYPAGTLNETTITDENGNAMIEYKDIDGIVVSKKVQSGTGIYLTTDYIHDDLGNLRYVIPPLPAASGTNIAVAIPSSFTESNAVFQNYFYAYHYDDLGRIIEKKSPGQDWQYIVYNSKDQPIMSQDANQRNMGIWMVNKYDGLGRIVMTGELTTASLRSTLQSAADASPTSTYESFTNVTTNYGYTHISYPDISPGTGKKVLTVSYYDSYDVIGNTAVNPGSSIFGAPSTAIDSLNKNPRGLPVATLTNVLGTANYLFAVTHYDKDGRVVKVLSQHYQGGSVAYNKYDTEENQFSFQSVLTQTTYKHYLPAATTPQLTINTVPAYDHMNRVLLTKQQYNTPAVTSGPVVALARNDYNELGQVITKHLHSTSTASGMPLGNTFLQHIDYRYNSRAWLMRINNAASTTDETFTSQLDVFGENLDYDQLTNGLGGAAQYNGNISAIKWQTKLPGAGTQEYKGYVLTYDQLNRLTNAAYKAQTTANNSSYDETVNYDELGNILSLIRKNGPTATLNSITYSYMNAGARSNKLWAVTDAGTESFSTTYNYNSNGSLVSDTRKTVTGINYNELNLPAQVTITTGTKVVKNIYDASGRKLERLITLNGTLAEDRYYVNDIEYVSNTIEAVHTPEGRALPSSGGYIMEYKVTDHLGNVRAMFGDKNNNGILEASEIIQTSDYYAFGREISSGSVVYPENQYKYNGKEFQKDLGTYDYGARFYDAVIGRWNVVDPLAEKSRRWSPYNYVMDNPIRNIDPDGMEADGPTWTDGYSTYSYANTPYNIEMNTYDEGEKKSNWVWNTKTHKIRFDPNVQSAANVGKDEQFVGQTGTGTTDEGYRIFLWADGTYDVQQQAPQHTPYIYTYQAFQDGIRAYLPALNFAKYTCIGTTWIIGGGLAGGEAAGNFLIDRGDRLAEFFAGLSESSPAVTKTAQVILNKLAGDTFRNELAEALRAEGREVALEVGKRTPFGMRYIDIEVKYGGKILGGIETKVGRSLYTPMQRLKDIWLDFNTPGGYPVQLVRQP